MSLPQQPTLPPCPSTGFQPVRAWPTCVTKSAASWPGDSGGPLYRGDSAGLTVVGVNKFVDENENVEVDLLRVDPQIEVDQVERLKRFKADRDHELLNAKLDAMVETARGDGNVLVPMREALKAGASIGEVCGALRDEWGEFQETL